MVRVIAPEGFMEEATSENVIAGIAMLRRSQFMYGSQLPRSARGHIGSGLGKNPALGTVGILQPTDIVNHDTHELTVDGVTIQFLYAPESEAPAEYMFYLPQYEAFCGAEVVSSNLHNLYTLRGAKVRNALKWSFYINESIDLLMMRKFTLEVITGLAGDVKTSSVSSRYSVILTNISTTKQPVYLTPA